MALQELGQKIRLAREEKGMALEDVAQKIKLSVTILKAIESGDSSALPHAVYTKGFTRSYAASVGLDLEEIKSLLETSFSAEIAEDAQPEASMTQKYQQQNTSKSAAFYAIVLLLVALLGSLVWYVGNNYGDAMLAAIKKPFTSEESAVQPPEQEAAVEVSPPAVEPDPNPAELHQEEEPQTEPAPVAEPQPQEAIQPEPVQAEQLAAATVLVSPATTGANEVDIVASEECYLRIKRDGAGYVHHTLKPGEQYKVRFDQKLNVLFGNAGGVSVKYNNKDMGVLGEKWQKREYTFPQVN